MAKPFTILAIETSCDETSIALVECTGGLRAPQFNIIKNIVSSQIPIHRPFGGVVPNLAKREHIKNLPLVLRRVFANPKSKTLINRLTDQPINLIAVTVGPGLEPALWTGIEFAKELKATSDKRQGKKIPLVGANHLKGHLYSFLGVPASHPDPPAGGEGSHKILPRLARRDQNDKIQFPAIGLIVSGGHTILLKLDSLTKWKKLGETRDDAAGEAFDKVARMMGLPYPGGPEISRLATSGKRQTINFPRPMLHDKNYDFSFSGLKTAVLYYLRDHKPQIDADQNADRRRSKSIRVNLREHPHESADAADVAASFQQAVVDVLTHKTMRAAQEFGARSIILCGGVAANKLLRKTLAICAKRFAIRLFVPPNDLNGDNAAMIAMAAYIDHLKKGKKLKMEAKGNLNL